jgi:hypothetical protein
MDAIRLLLTVAFRHAIIEATVEAGYLRFVALAGTAAVDYETFCDAIAHCLSQGLIREPIRLSEGALQCQWHLELTPAGVTAARDCLGNRNDVPSDVSSDN